MSKFSNLQKGLAVSAALVIGLTGAISAPAFAGTATYGAADRTKVTLAPNTGVDWAVISSDTFTMKSELPGNNVYTGGSLKWLLKGDAIDGLATPNGFTATEGSGLNVTLNSDFSGTSGSYNVTFDDTYNFATGDSIVITGSTTSQVLAYFPDNTFDQDTGDGENDMDGDGGSDPDQAVVTLPVFNGTHVVGTAGVTLVNTNTIRIPITLPTVQGTANNDAAVSATSYDVTSFTKDFAGATTRPAGDAISINDSDNGVVVDSRLNGNDNAVRTLVISSAADMTVEVTAWYDSNNDGDIDSNEFASESEIVRFVNADDVVAETFGFSRSGNTFVALTKVSPQLNSEQSSLTPRVLFTNADTNLVAGASDYDSATSTYSSTTGLWTSTSGTIASAGYWSARPYLGARANLANHEIPLRSTSTSLVVGVTSATQLDVTTTPSADVQAAIATEGSDDTAAVRLGTASIPLKVVATDADGESVGAGKDVRISWAGTAFTVNGSTSPVTVQTDASGSATVTVAKTTATTAGSVALKFEINTTGSAVLDTTMTVSWAAASYSLFNLADNSSNAIVSAVGIPASGSHTYNFIYVDQWRVSAPADTYRLNVAVSGAATNTGSQTLAVSQSGTSLTVTSNGTVGDSAISVVVTPEKLTNAVWIAGGSTTLQVTVHRAVASKIAFDSQDSDFVDYIQETYTVGAFDPRTQNALRQDYSSDYVNLEGRVTDAVSGLPVPYAKVTLSGDSAFMFTTGDVERFSGDRIGEVDKMGSITVYASSTGYWNVDVFSNKSVFDSVITATSAGATATTKITFLPADEESGASVTVEAPKSIKVGKTLAVSFTLKDDFGNPVNNVGYGEFDDNYDNDFSDEAFDTPVRVIYNGPGLLINDRGAGRSEVGYDGKVTTRVLMGSRDFGVATFTYIYLEDDDDEVNRRSVTKTVSVWVGPIVDVKAGAKKGRVVVDAYRVKGQTVNVFVGGEKVGSFVADKAVDRYVVKGIKKGAKNVSARIVGPGKDVTKRVTIK
jgi:hypothetical protein